MATDGEQDFDSVISAYVNVLGAACVMAGYDHDESVKYVRSVFDWADDDPALLMRDIGVSLITLSSDVTSHFQDALKRNPDVLRQWKESLDGK